MMTLDVIGHVVEDIYFPTGSEQDWEVEYDPEDHCYRFETCVGHGHDVVEHLRCNYPKEWRQINSLTDTLRDGYALWLDDGSADPADDLDHRYDVDVSHLVEEHDGGWTIHMRAGYGWWDVWQPLGEVYVPLDMTEAELRKAIADTLGPALSFLHPRQLEDDHE